MTLMEVRKKKGLTQTELDRQAGLPRGTTSDIELGRNNNPTLKVARRLAGVLEIDIQSLFPAENDAA